MKKILSAILITCTAGPAFAGALIFEPPVDPVVVAPPPPAAPPPPVFAGPYFGAQIGYGILEVETGTSYDDDGIIGGLHFGYDFALGRNFVFGAEAAYDHFDAAPSELLLTVEANHLARITARAGYSFGRTLVYAKGGMEYLDADVILAGRLLGGDDWGWVAGGGVEHLVTDRISAGVEGLYHQWDDFEDGLISDLEATTIQARVSLRF